MTFWWQRYPERWQREIEALDAFGWTYRVLESAGDRLILILYRLPEAGRGRQQEVMELELTDAGAGSREVRRQVVLLVRFPGVFPFAPPFVFDRSARLPLQHHRDPTNGHLCLCESADWDLDTTAAELIDSQLPLVLAANDPVGDSTLAHTGMPFGLDLSARIAGARGELPFPEPVSTYARLGGHAAILVDGSWEIPVEVRHGALIAHLARSPQRPRLGELGPGCVSLLLGPNLERAMPREIVRFFPTVVAGAWMRWDGYRPGMTGVEVYEAIEDSLPFIEVDDDDIVQNPELVSVVGLLVPSEIRYREMGEQWLFLIVHRPDPDTDFTVDLTLGQYAGSIDVLARLPHTTDLVSKSVLIAGVGAVGGRIAEELGRAGIGRLGIVDSDSADIGTSVRQYSPPTAAGLPKAHVVRAGIRMTSPLCRVSAHVTDIGRTLAREHEELEWLVATTDLMVDATADPAVTRYLAALARATRKPYVHASATPGAWGGTVVVLIPDADAGACWGCLDHHRADGATPIPPAKPRDGHHPIGCSQPTFTGTSADLGHVALHATRIALDALAQTVRRSDLYTLSLRNERGDAIPASWQVTPIERHPACGNHSTIAGRRLA